MPSPSSTTSNGWVARSTRNPTMCSLAPGRWRQALVRIRSWLIPKRRKTTAPAVPSGLSWNLIMRIGQRRYPQSAASGR
jgi:hypothetical protein